MRCFRSRFLTRLNESLRQIETILFEEHEDAQRRAKELASQGKSKSEIRRAILDEFPGVPINKGLDIADQAAANPGRSVPKGGMAAFLGHTVSKSDLKDMKNAARYFSDAVGMWIDEIGEVDVLLDALTFLSQANVSDDEQEIGDLLYYAAGYVSAASGGGGLISMPRAYVKGKVDAAHTNVNKVLASSRGWKQSTGNGGRSNTTLPIPPLQW